MMTWIERLFARVGYVPADRYVPQEHVDDVERVLGDTQAQLGEALQSAWAESDRERIKRAAAEDELEQRTRLVGVLLEEIGARSWMARTCCFTSPRLRRFTCGIGVRSAGKRTEK